MQTAKTKIRFIEIASTDRECFISGKEYELPTEEAAAHVRAGHAVVVAEPKPQPVAVAPTKTTKTPTR